MTLPINPNLVSNPSFREGIEGWEGLTATIEASSTGGYGTDPECVRVIKTIEEYSGIQSTRTISVNSRGESNVYSASAYVRIPTGEDSGTLMLSIMWYTQGLTYIESADSTPTAVTASASTWTRLTKANVIPPANARYAAIRVVQTTGGNAGEIFLVDAVKLEVGSTVTAFKELIDQGQENAVVNRGLTRVPTPHLTGMQLNADIQLGDMTFNTIDNEGYVFVITDITGMFGTPEPEFAEMSRGMYRDGDYDTRGRYKARYINLTGSVLVPGPEYVTEARDKIIRAADLVRNGTWLKLKPANEPVKAMFVRLNGAVNTDIVNPRGRIDFSIGLKAADPVLYEWNEERVDGYTVANIYASNYSGNEAGSVEVGTTGNYTVGAIYEVRGPILGQSASIFNYTNGEMATITGRIRGERYRDISQKKLEDRVVTLNFSKSHDFEVGDTVYVSLANSIALTNVVRGSGNTYATVGSSVAAAYIDGDRVVLSNVHSTLDGQLLTISNVTSTSFTVPSTNTAALSNLALSSATANNETNNLLNGDQVVVATPNNKSIQYYIDSRDSISLANVGAAYQAGMRNVVYRDADYLEIDTANNEVAINGTVSGARGVLDALIDWVKLEAGNNVIELDDSGQLPMYVEKRTILANGIATLYTSVPHGLIVGDNIHVDYVGTPYDTPGRSLVTQYYRDGYTATIVSEAHSFPNGSYVTLSSVSRGIDGGPYTVENATANTFKVTTNTSATEYRVPVSGVAKQIYPIQTYAKTNNTVTLVTGAYYLFSAGDAIYVTGVSEEVDGEQIITSTNSNVGSISYSTQSRKPAGKIVETAAPMNAQIAPRYPVLATTEYSFTYDTSETATPETNVQSGMLAQTDNGGFVSISAYSRTTNVATVTTTTKHGFSAGDFVTVSGTANTAFNVGYGNQIQISSYTISGNTVKAIVNGHGFVTNDTVKVYNINTGVSGLDINGTYPVTSLNVNAVSYTLDSALTLSYITTGRELSNNFARLYLKNTPEFEATDADGNATSITVSNLGSPFDGQFSVASVRLEDNSVTYAVTSTNVTYSADTDGAVALTIDDTPERAFMYQKNEVMYYTINASISDSTNTITGTYAHLKTLNDHGLIVGDTVEITGVSSLVDGVRKIVYKATDSSFTVEIENSSLVQRRSATGTRPVNSYSATITSAGHGRVKGDWIYFDNNTGSNLTASGKFEIKSVVNVNAFTISSTTNSGTGYTATTAKYWWPLRLSGFATKVYPILSAPAPTDYTFSYSNPCTTPTVANTAVTRNGEVVQQSSARMKVYYRSGWIG
jgi:hypothetical protein